MCRKLLLVLLFLLWGLFQAQADYISTHKADWSNLKLEFQKLKVITLNYSQLMKDLELTVENLKEDLTKEREVLTKERDTSENLRILSADQGNLIGRQNKALEDLRKYSINIEFLKNFWRYAFIIAIPISIVATAILTGIATYQITIRFK